MKIVYAKQSASIMMPEGYPVMVPLGTHWWADDPVVRANPDLFSDDPRHGLVGHAPADEVEAATVNPGEKRSVRRG
jgi:hypothetical protein